MSHFLQLDNNHVLGVDMSLSSLRLAIEHKHQNGLARSGFAQMNIFNLAVKDASFDVVISHGVLHHTFNARRAFGAIARKAKPGGVVVIGLYNNYARIPTWMRSKIIGVTGINIDYVVRNRIRDRRKAEIWIKDQYYNPHETWHSIGEVLSGSMKTTSSTSIVRRPFWGRTAKTPKPPEPCLNKRVREPLISGWEHNCPGSEPLPARARCSMLSVEKKEQPDE